MLACGGFVMFRTNLGFTYDLDPSIGKELVLLPANLPSLILTELSIKC